MTLFFLSTFAAASAFDLPALAQVLEKPAKQLKGDGPTHLRSSQRLLIPAYYSENLIAGALKANKAGAQAKLMAVSVGITPELSALIADALLDDLVSKLLYHKRERHLHAARERRRADEDVGVEMSSDSSLLNFATFCSMPRAAI